MDKIIEKKPKRFKLSAQHEASQWLLPLCCVTEHYSHSYIHLQSKLL